MDMVDTKRHKKGRTLRQEITSHLREAHSPLGAHESEVAVNLQMRLGDLLVKNGLITEEELEAALKSQQFSSRKRLGEILVDNDRLAKRDLLKMLSLQLEIPLFDLEKTEIDVSAVRMFPEKMALKYGCAPIRREDNELIVVMADPLNLQAIDDLKQMTRCEIKLAVGDRQQIEDIIRKCHAANSAADITESLPELDGLFKVVKLFNEDNGHEESVTDLKVQSQQAPIIRIVNIIINEAIEERATDIHIEPQADSLIVRDRIDGVLYEKHHLPQWIHLPVVSRIKIMADMDIAEKRIPQDGKVRISLGSRYFDLRISTLPSIFGEKVAIRLLERRGHSARLDELGFDASQLKQIRSSNSRKQGLVLVTGPTGSGKSTTLNSMLREIKNPNINIVTVEDPVEYEISKLTQVQVNPKAGLTFPYVLRSILRQDPDVIMLGEIRDSETAEITLRAAMTGHLVLSTLHTNDATSAVTRLINLGMPPYLVSSTVLYVLAQRLIRRLCPHCAVDYEPSAGEIDHVERFLSKARELAWRMGEGCTRCNQRGFSGRLAVSELFVANNEIRDAIETQQPESVLHRLAVLHGMRPLLDDFVEKVSLGLTAMSEIWNVIVGEEVASGVCPKCSVRIEQSYISCPSCGFALKDKCSECGQPMEKNWSFCPHCRKQQ